MFVLVGLVLLLSTQCVISKELAIGGLFYETDEYLKIALEAGVKLSNNPNLTTSIKELSIKGNILDISEKVCELAQEGVIGIIDGIGGRASEHIQALCDILELPHVLIYQNDLYSSNWSAINLFPSPTAFNMAVQQVIIEKEWRNFTIFYVRGYSLLRLTDLLYMGNESYRYVVSLRELSGNDYRDVLLNAKLNGYRNFVVDCQSRYLDQFLLHAQQVGLMSEEYSYIFTSPDLFTLNMTRYRYGGVNMTGFRLVDLVNSKNEKLWNFTIEVSEGMPLGAEDLKTQSHLVHDAVLVFTEGIKKIDVHTEGIKKIDLHTESLSCENYDSWLYGSSLLNFMKTNVVDGITRTIQFDGTGVRNDVSFDILELTPAGNQTIAIWQDNELLIQRPPLNDAEIRELSPLKNKTLKVLIALTEPHAYLKEEQQVLTGNDRYEGFSIDLIDMLSEKLGFSYEFVVETVYGGLEDNGSYSGMVLQLMVEKADLAICDFTITANRQTGIDFSTPFMTLGIGILYKEPSKQPPEMFSFMAPFSKKVWYYMMLIQLALGVTMIFVGRISHKEWQNPVPCVEQPEELSNQFSFANSVWLIIGSVMQQGSEIAPIALAPRMITSVWWFFTMVMVALYVGTLVAFLTVETNVLPFTTVEELYNRTSIAYGCKRQGSTKAFFEGATSGIYKSMFEKMIKNNWLAETNEAGVERTEKENYAMFMESTTIEYFTERHCDLMSVGGLLDSKSYGIGMKRGSPYKKYIDDALLKLKERGEIAKLKDLWWKEKHGGGKCGEKSTESLKQLGLKNMVGAFVVLGVGCLIGLFISIMDMLWGVFKRTVKYGTTFKYELIEELKFAIKFSGSVKPVKRQSKAIDDSAETLAEAEGKDEVRSLRSIKSARSTDTHATQHSHSSRHSSRSLSVAFARQRKYT